MFSLPAFVQFGCGISRQIGAMLADAALQELSTQTTPRKPSVAEVIALYEKAW
jgi:alcohol dehydrogenase class IV